jgi:hypothetical protein
MESSVTHNSGVRIETIGLPCYAAKPTNIFLRNWIGWFIAYAWHFYFYFSLKSYTCKLQPFFPSQIHTDSGQTANRQCGSPRKSQTLVGSLHFQRFFVCGSPRKSQTLVGSLHFLHFFRSPFAKEESNIIRFAPFPAFFSFAVRQGRVKHY